MVSHYSTHPIATEGRYGVDSMKGTVGIAAANNVEDVTNKLVT